MFGFLNVYKPKGPTSHDIVVQVRRMLPRKTRVGHAGTLDPFAKGVLVLCVGQATRLAEFVQSQPKRYVAVVKLGAVSATDDPEGPITPTPSPTPPTEQQIRDVLTNFVGEIQQVPPAHSAVHVDGRRAYELAREGKNVEIPARSVIVHKLSLRRYEYPKLKIDVHCGSGTYVRSLARDIGEALGTGGYCYKLKRTAVGGFDIKNALPPEQIEIPYDLLPPHTGLDTPLVLIDETATAAVAMGKTIPIEPYIATPVQTGQTIGLIGTGQAGNPHPASIELLAIATISADAKTIRPTKVFISPQS